MLNDQIKNYLKDHWISMAISLGTSSIIFIITIINLYTNFRIDYTALKRQVSASANITSNIVAVHTQLLQKVTQIDQKVTDDHDKINDIYTYFFGKLKP